MVGPPLLPDANRIWSTTLGYARRGTPVLPVDPESKAPLTKGGVYDASTDLRQLSHWWRDLGHQAGLVVPTGQQSGIDALDVDPRHGASLFICLYRLETRRAAIIDRRWP